MSIWNEFVEHINNFGYTYTIPDDIDYFYGKIPLVGYTHKWEYLSIENVKKISERFEKKEKFENSEDWFALLVKMKDGHWYDIEEYNNCNDFWLRNYDNDDDF